MLRIFWADNCRKSHFYCWLLNLGVKCHLFSLKMFFYRTPCTTRILFLGLLIYKIKTLSMLSSSRNFYYGTQFTVCCRAELKFGENLYNYINKMALGCLVAVVPACILWKTTVRHYSCVQRIYSAVEALLDCCLCHQLHHRHYRQQHLLHKVLHVAVIVPRPV